MLMPKTLRLTLLSIFLLMTVPFLAAQVDFASLTGLVTDPTGASIRGAAVTATNRANGFERSTVTDDSGYYNFPSLPAGSYNIAVKENGFASQTQAISLDPSAKARQDFQLAVGAATATVEVQAETPQMSWPSAGRISLLRPWRTIFVWASFTTTLTISSSPSA